MGEVIDSFIEIKNITKKYDDGYVAVKNISFDISKGEFVTILGPSGCGKTTLLKMIGGFELSTKGQILLKKIDIKDLPVQRRPTATVFQDYALFPNMNVEKNIAYGLKEIRKPIENLDKNLLKDKTKIFEDAVKKSNSKIKEINKKKDNISKEILKFKKKIEKDKYLRELKLLSDEEIKDKLNLIKDEYYIKTNKNLIKSIPLDIRLFETINSILYFLNFPKYIKYKTKQNEDLIEKFLAIKRKNRQINFIKNQIDSLEEEYNSLDYWVSYWQNFPDQEIEWFEKKNLTRKLTQEEINQEINKIIKLVGLENKNKKMPTELSGGMQQRVALARAIVTKPDILLLDEPLSALDAQVRKQMQQELKRLHNELGITFILVTHDQEEALSLSTKVIVMSNGNIEQIGSPLQIYDKPLNKWVAKFIGQANLFTGEVIDKNFVLINNEKFKYDSKQYNNFEIGEKVNILIRPEDFDVVPKSKGKIKVKITQTIYKGLLWELTCNWNDYSINIESINKVDINKEVWISWDLDDVHLMKVEQNE